MEATGINLHIDRKKVLLLIALFSLLSLIIDGSVMLSINEKLIQLKGLQNSRYVYSATSATSIGQDEFLIYDAGISFSNLPDSDTSLNVDVVMQSDGAKYNGMICWQAEKLGQYSVAITDGVARFNHLSVGSKLYSKHSVDGTVHEYTVEEIVPDTINLRTTKNTAFTSGLVIMGYDKQYADSLSHKYLCFTDMPVEDFSELSGSTMDNILYREDEVAHILQSAIPYLLVLTVVSMLLITVLSVFVVNGFSHNFKRLIVLGYDKRLLDNAYRKSVYRICGASVLTALIVNMMLLALMRICSYGFALLGGVALLELFVLSIAAIMQRGQLWRK